MGDKEGCFMNPLTSQFWMGIGVAVLCGGIVGFERHFRGKTAGIRTNIFVRLGVTFAGPQTDPTRVLGQVAVGIGFLGAGVIIAREGLVKGVTTAAVIWVLAGIGAMIGFGKFAAAIVLAIVTIGILTGIEMFEKGVRWLRSGEHEREDEE
jgi:putative Mg2+ transporter-C (MgtC) family protein